MGLWQMGVHMAMVWQTHEKPCSAVGSLQVEVVFGAAWRSR